MLSLSARIIEVLAYFDLFSYPLTAQEINGFLPAVFSEEQTAEAIAVLIADKRIFNIGAFYALRNDFALAARRIEANYHAGRALKVAFRTSRLLFHFPFVRAVCISGSLSKNCSGEKSDIDYFIVTRAERLWIGRTLMHLFKKITFLAGKQHWYCMNYYVDEQALQIREKNVYTAMEIVTLVPMQGPGVVEKFFVANHWTKRYFPGPFLLAPQPVRFSSEWKGKKFLERLFENRFGDWLDDILMHITRKRWAKKEVLGRTNMNGNRVGIEAAKHFCKPNPRYMQQSVLSRYYAKLEELKLDFDRIPDP